MSVDALSAGTNQPHKNFYFAQQPQSPIAAPVPLSSHLEKTASYKNPSAAYHNQVHHQPPPHKLAKNSAGLTNTSSVVAAQNLVNSQPLSASHPHLPSSTPPTSQQKLSKKHSSTTQGLNIPGSGKDLEQLASVTLLTNSTGFSGFIIQRPVSPGPQGDTQINLGYSNSADRSQRKLVFGAQERGSAVTNKTAAAQVAPVGAHMAPSAATAPGVSSGTKSLNTSKHNVSANTTILPPISRDGHLCKPDFPLSFFCFSASLVI